MAGVRFRGEVAVALAVLGLAAFIAIETFSITVSPGYARVGPRVVPFAVAALMAGLGMALLVAALRGGWAAEPAQHRNLLALLPIAGGLAAYIVLLKTAGFILASTLLFVAVARAFASKRLLRDAAIGLALAGATFLLFTRVLQLPLPPGTIWLGG